MDEKGHSVDPRPAGCLVSIFYLRDFVGFKHVFEEICKKR